MSNNDSVPLEDLAAVDQIRLNENLTYAELGEQIGISGAALHRTLKRRSEPLDRTLHKIRRFLDARVSQDRRRRGGRRA